MRARGGQIGSWESGWIDHGSPISYFIYWGGGTKRSLIYIDGAIFEMTSCQVYDVRHKMKT